MSRFWNPAIEELSPYVPGEQPKQQDLIKLNTNEMPVGPSPRVLAALRVGARLDVAHQGDVLAAVAARQVVVLLARASRRQEIAGDVDVAAGQVAQLRPTKVEAGAAINSS